MTTNKAVTTKSNVPTIKKGTEVFISEAPEDIDLGQDIAEFGANYSSSQMSMPFLNILQALSPQVTRGKDEFIPDAKTGEFYNSVTKKLYDGEIGLDIIFGNFKASYIEWLHPRKGGGSGFVAEHTELDGSKAKVVVAPDNARIIQPDSVIGTPGNNLSLTHTRMAFILSDDFSRWEPVLISMSASQIKVSANFNARHKLLEWMNPQTGQIQKGPPLPLCVWHVKSKITQNDNGSWFSWDIAFKGFLHQMPEIDGWKLYREARDFVKSSRGQQAMENAAVELAKSANNDEIPF